MSVVLAAMAPPVVMPAVIVVALPVVLVKIARPILTPVLAGTV